MEECANAGPGGSLADDTFPTDLSPAEGASLACAAAEYLAPLDAMLRASVGATDAEIVRTALDEAWKLAGRTSSIATITAQSISGLIADDDAPGWTLQRAMLANTTLRSGVRAAGR